MPRSSEIQVLLGILHRTWQTYMGETEGRKEEGRESRIFYPPPLHPAGPQATALRHSSSQGSSSHCACPLLLAHVVLKPALANPWCLTSLWFYEHCPHHCKWSPLRNLSSVVHLEYADCCLLALIHSDFSLPPLDVAS